MKRCPTCDREYPADAAFCMADGTKLEAAAPAVQAEAPEAPAPKAAAPEQPPAGKSSPSVDAPTVDFGTTSKPAPQEASPTVEVVIKPRQAPQKPEPARPAARKQQQPQHPTAPQRPAARREALELMGADPAKKAAEASRDEEARRKAKKKLTSSISRIRNPWAGVLEADAPNTVEFERMNMERARKRSTEEQKAQEGFSETLWFLEGDKPEEVNRMEEEGAVELADGSYKKKEELDDDTRSSYSLDE